jgi:hypothetical protein
MGHPAQQTPVRGESPGPVLPLIDPLWHHAINAVGIFILPSAVPKFSFPLWRHRRLPVRRPMAEPPMIRAV